MTYRLTLGKDVLFESTAPLELVQHLVDKFPPEGDFPSPNPHNAGFAIVLPTGDRLQGLRAERWVRQARLATKMNNSAAAVAGAILEQAYCEIQRQFPHAAPAHIEQFVKEQFQRANTGIEPLNAEVIVASFRRLHGEQ